MAAHKYTDKLDRLTDEDRRRIVKELRETVEERLFKGLGLLHSVEHWNGHELRAALASMYTDMARATIMKRQPNCKRSKDFRDRLGHM